VAGTHDWLGERAILAEKNKDVEERNNIIQSVTGKGHINAWPGTASTYIKPVLTFHNKFHVFITKLLSRYITHSLTGKGEARYVAPLIFVKNQNLKKRRENEIMCQILLSKGPSAVEHADSKIRVTCKNILKQLICNLDLGLVHPVVHVL
jgi:hypothetical protein